MFFLFLGCGPYVRCSSRSSEPSFEILDPLLSSLEVRAAKTRLRSVPAPRATHRVGHGAPEKGSGFLTYVRNTNGTYVPCEPSAMSNASLRFVLLSSISKELRHIVDLWTPYWKRYVPKGISAANYYFPFVRDYIDTLGWMWNEKMDTVPLGPMRKSMQAWMCDLTRVSVQQGHSVQHLLVLPT